jgi:gamma-glutamyltranspeptidase/glutathione hydrolase
MFPKRLFLVLLLFGFVSAQAGGAKSPARARNGMVVSAHHLASQAGIDILKRGGNAVDAAIATGLALAVVHPAAGNIGGGGFMIVFTSEGEVTAFDFREKAPLAAQEGMYVDAKGNYVKDLNHEGYLAVGVPGTIAGFDLALKRFGKKTWSELAAPAVNLAEKGFVLSWALAADFKSERSDFSRYSSSMKVFFKKNGADYEKGEVWKQPDLARTLKRIQKNGKDGFYKGDIARVLAADMKKNGGLITEADLASYEAKERVPLHGVYRGHDIYSMCPPSSGGTTLIEMLNILEGYDLKSYGHNSAQYLHLLAEAMRRAFADRANHVGDPDFNPEMPIARLTSKEYAEQLRKSVSMSHASKSDPEKFNQAYESSQTTHFSVVDKDGNAVVVTYTLEYGYGSHIVVEGFGFLLNNEMGDFNPSPGRTDSTDMIGTKPNLVAPGKRMLSSMSPTIIAKDGKPWALIGSPGGRTIINTVLQVTLNLVDFGMNISEAVTAGRVHHQWLPDVLAMERYATSPDTKRLLEGMGHRITLVRGQGSVMGIMIDQKEKLFLGAADPRQADGAAVGY